MRSIIGAGLTLCYVGGRVDFGALILFELGLKMLQSPSSVLSGLVFLLPETAFFPLQAPAVPVPMSVVRCVILRPIKQRLKRH